MAEDKLKDPVKKPERAGEEDVNLFDISNLNMSDWKPITNRQARLSHPFDGYPVKRKVPVYSDGKIKSKKPLMQSATYLIAMKPGDLKSYPHSRFIRDYANGYNVDVVFDKTMTMQDNTVIKNIAIVKDPNIRAQICFNINPRKEGSAMVERDERYLLLDNEQGRTLRRTFEMIHSPRMRQERLAAAVSSESDESLENIPGVELEV